MKLKQYSPSKEEAPLPASDITVFGANSTLHGLSHIFLPGGVTIRRLLWAAAFSSSLSIFLYQVVGRVIEYYQYPYVTILDEMDSPTMTFPAITLCNYNRFRKSQVRRNDIFWMGGVIGVGQADMDDYMTLIGQPTGSTGFYPSKTYSMLEFLTMGKRQGTHWTGRQGVFGLWEEAEENPRKHRENMLWPGSPGT
uniref:Uncharacterized protein n=1 Tax=Monopterus albus TaxID=43700 RepID=A0A3Q3KB80_MONAL